MTKNERIFVVLRFFRLYWGRFALVLCLFIGVVILFVKLPNILSYMINANTARTEKSLSSLQDPKANLQVKHGNSLLNPEEFSQDPAEYFQDSENTLHNPASVLPSLTLDILFVRDDSILTDKGVLHIGDSCDGYTLLLISRPSRTCHFSSDYGDVVLRY